jgi:nitrate reductase gamma subunit
MGINFEALHFIALAFMVVVYTIRIIWILRFKLVRDIARPIGSSAYYGAALAMTTLFRPWSMETTRKGWLHWLEFAVFHVGIAVMIGTSFLMPFFPHWFSLTVIIGISLSQVLALAAGLVRLGMRIRIPHLKAVSSPDDFFSLIMVNILFLACLLAVWGVHYGHEIYFALLAFVIAYVPFSKISHYFYYPIARYFYGSYLARRGILR